MARPRISTPAVAGQAWRMLNRPDMAASRRIPQCPGAPSKPSLLDRQARLARLASPRPLGAGQPASVGNSPRRQTTRLASLAAAPVRTMHAPWATKSPARCAHFVGPKRSTLCARFCETCAALPMRKSDSTRASTLAESPSQKLTCPTHPKPPRPAPPTKQCTHRRHSPLPPCQVSMLHCIPRCQPSARQTSVTPHCLQLVFVMVMHHCARPRGRWQKREEQKAKVVRKGILPRERQASKCCP